MKKASFLHLCTININFVYESSGFAADSYKININSSPSLSVTGHPAHFPHRPAAELPRCGSSQSREAAPRRGLSSTQAARAPRITNSDHNLLISVLMNLRAAGPQNSLKREKELSEIFDFT